MAKLSTILIGFAVLAIFATLFTVSITRYSDVYDKTYDNSSLSEIATFNQIEKINNLTVAAEGNLSISDNTDLSDVLGGLFKSGYSALIITKESFGLFFGAGTNTVVDTTLGEGEQGIGNVIKLVVGAIATIFIVFLLISILVRRDT